MNFHKTSRNLVQGYLKRQENKLVNGNGEEIILTGWGLGNWLLPEGYMWLYDGNSRMDRPRRIEAVVEELTGKAYAEQFWAKFQENYITENDIEHMAELGYNSVRIPILWRLFMEEGEGNVFIENGFRLLDQCIDWCEKHKLYVFIDLHGAPGGQTGANIDDSIDDVPRLFTDQDSWDKAIALWVKIANRYKDRWIVGGYDLLNEPIRPENVDGRNFDFLVDKLRQFYTDVIKAIREVDKVHLFSIEGHHWSTDTAIFDRLYDENMVIHFHRYGCKPDIRIPRIIKEMESSIVAWGNRGEL
jgi:aryl-phospho-beta-D-glucosidase BglC (GH1 family)